jgi:hypothetical protein
MNTQKRPLNIGDTVEVMTWIKGQISGREQVIDELADGQFHDLYRLSFTLETVEHGRVEATLLFESDQVTQRYLNNMEQEEVA